MSEAPFKFGFWSDKEYHLDRMNLAGLTRAYFQYYAIAAYIDGLTEPGPGAR